MTSLNEKNLSASSYCWKNILQRPVNILFYVGVLVLIVAALIPIFENIAWGDLFFILFCLGFGYWGYQHGQVDQQTPSEHSVHYWEIALALLGLITVFGIYLTLAMAFKYDFQTVFDYIVSRFILVVIVYALGYYSSHRLRSR